MYFFERAKQTNERVPNSLDPSIQTPCPLPLFSSCAGSFSLDLYSRAKADCVGCDSCLLRDGRYEVGSSSRFEAIPGHP